MNDFLQSIRNNSKDKRYNKNRRSYDGNNGYNHHAGENKRNGNEKRNKNYRGNTAFDSITNETMIAVKNVLTELVGTQKQSIEVEKRRAAAEERKAEALESIAVYVKNLAGGGLASVENHTKCPAATTSAAEESGEKTLATASSESETFAEKVPSGLNRDAIVQMIRDLREEGSTYELIAQQLTSKNIPTFSGRGEWHAQTIHRLCRKK